MCWYTQASTAPASSTSVLEQQWARKRGTPEEQQEEPQGLAPVAACVGPQLSDEEARSALGEYFYVRITATPHALLQSGGLWRSGLTCAVL